MGNFAEAVKQWSASGISKQSDQQAEQLLHFQLICVLMNVSDIIVKLQQIYA